MSSPQWDDALRQGFSMVKKRFGFGGGSKGLRAPAKRGFQRLGTAACLLDARVPEPVGAGLEDVAFGPV
ncbi:hypothetical protein Bca4012_095318 [Brassica carinata]|uniref:Uncharacterized protein n=1 Tax=Brassica carinata TaxID=52824 RepID=A0A8X7PWG6_BRACI|nr:hypothetical protein Bca52824_077321 [Brassica carinata]